MCVSEHAWAVQQHYKNMENNHKLEKGNENIGYGILISAALHSVI